MGTKSRRRIHIAGSLIAATLSPHAIAQDPARDILIGVLVHH